MRFQPFAAILLLTAWALTSLPANAGVVELAPLAPGPHAEDDSAQLFPPQVVRQAVLAAARETFGATTRDGDLLESADGLDPVGFAVKTTFWPGKEARVELTQADGEGAPLWTSRFELPGKADDVLAIVEAVTAAPGLEAALQTAGLAGEPTGWNADAPTDPRVLELLDDIHFVSQYQAVRLLHKQSREGGWSEARLAALVRGYSNLCELTHPLWGLSSDVYGARALVYAQRLVQLTDGSQKAHEVRAYALALVGLHGPALAEIEAHGPAESAEDAWPFTSVTRAWALFDVDTMQQIVEADDERSTIGALLYALMYEHQFDRDRFGQACEWVRQFTGPTPRLIEPFSKPMAMTRRGYHVAGAGQQMASGVRARLKASPGLADAAVQILDEPEPQWRLATQITDAALELIDSNIADPHEPSLQTLGWLIHQWNFRLLTNELAWESKNGADAKSAFVQRTLPALAGHPHEAAFSLVSLGSPRKEGDLEAYRHVDERVPANVMTAPMIEFIRFHLGWLTSRMYDSKLYEPGQDRLLAQADDLYHDLATLTMHYQNNYESNHRRIKIWLDELRTYPPRLEHVSPHAPAYISCQIEYADFDQTRPMLETWGKRYGRHLCVVASLARRYRYERNLPASRSWIEKYLKASNEPWARQYLIDSYRLEGDFESWRQSTQDLVNDGMHTQAQLDADVVEWHLTRGFPEKATQSLNRLLVRDPGKHARLAHRYYELLGRWDLAMAWMQRDLKENRRNRVHWLIWCHRTGQMETVDQAIAATKPGLARYGQSGGAWYYKGLAYLLMGDEKNAYTNLRRMENVKASEPYIWMTAGAIMQLLDGKDRRSRFFHKKAQQRKLEHRPGNRDNDIQYEMCEMETILREARKRKDKQIDFAAVDRLTAQSTPGRANDVWFLVAGHLWANGQRDMAIEYLKRCAKQPVFQHSRTLAMWWLRKQGVAEEALHYDREQWKNLPDLSVAPDAEPAPAPEIRRPVHPEKPEQDETQPGGLM